MTSSFRLIRRAKLGGEPYPVVPETVGSGEIQEGTDESTPYEDERAREIEKAYQSGYQAGVQSCREELEESVKGVIKRFTSMIDDLASQRRRLLLDSEEAIVKLACEIAKRVIGTLAEVSEKPVIEVTKRALKYLSERQKITIRVNPEDAQILRKYSSDWLEGNASRDMVEIKEDARIKRGGCLIEGETGNVEAELDRQVEMIRRALLEAVNEG